MFPTSIEGQLTLPPSTDGAGALARAEEALRAAGASSLQRTDRRLAFVGQTLGRQGAPLSAIGQGQLWFDSPQSDALRFQFSLRGFSVFTALSVVGGGSLAAFLSGGWPLVLFLPLLWFAFASGVHWIKSQQLSAFLTQAIRADASRLTGGSS